MDLQMELFGLCRQVLAKELAPDALYGILKSKLEVNREVQSVIFDILLTLDAEMSSEKDSDTQKQYMDLIQVLNNRVVPEEILRLELQPLGASEPSTRSRIVKMKTKLFFKQVKFNLLREETEGYAKLLTELYETSPNSASNALVKLHRLIGQFNLDPNRVLDIILECFEANSNHWSFYVSLLNEFKANSDVLCNILGFKFTFYKKTNETPYSLYKLAAILCAERLIDLLPLCAFLTPKLDGIVADHKNRIERNVKRAKKAEIISTASISIENRSNSNTNFADDSLSTQVTGICLASVIAAQEAEDARLFDLENSDEIALSRNQKLGLTYALLEQGAWPLAKQMLDRFPEFYAVNASKKIALSIADLIERSIDDFYQEQVFLELKCKYAVGSSTNLAPFIHSHSLEIVGSWSELTSVVLPVLSYVGPLIAHQVKAAIKLIRLLSVYFEEKEKDPSLIESTHDDNVTNSLVDIIDEVLVPALSLSNANYSFSEELWNLISHLPYVARYRIYSRWKTLHTLRHQQINIMRGKTFGMTKYVIKRLSKETVRLMGRQLGKLCHVHPAVVFDYVLDQIQTFENLIEPVVESIRFLSNLEFDVLSFCIIEHLSSPDKLQLKASDGTLSTWLQALATLVATVFMRYNMEPTGILQYVANQLKNGKSFDLLILREIIQNMSGIESTTGLTNEQLEALSGGDTLRQEAGSFSTVRSNKRATARLREALSKDFLFVGLSILIAQQRQSIVYVESSNVPLKLAGQMLDQCQETFVQFGSFLRTGIRQEEYFNRMPSVSQLINEYYLNIDAAFFLSRPVIMHRVYALFDKRRKTMREPDGSKTKLDAGGKISIFQSALSEVTQDLESKLKPLLSETLCKNISTKVFVIFWSLSMYDINVPKAAYDREIQRVRRMQAALVESTELSKTKRLREEEQLKNIEKKLLDDLKKQQEHVERVLSILKSDKDLLFADFIPKYRAPQMSQFLQSCILPRAVFTDMDAAYCAHFILLLHQHRTAFFQTVYFFDKLFNDIGIILAAFSENEANCFGRFLLLILETVQRWHSDKAIFDKECSHFPGFMSKCLSKQTENKDGPSSDIVNYETYRKFCHKWQVRLTKSCIGILEGSSYVLLRNCMIVMIKILPQFPLIESHLMNVEKSISGVRDSEKGSRDDLSLIAASYLGHLRMRKAQTFIETQFYNKKALDGNKRPQRIVAPKKIDLKQGMARAMDLTRDGRTLIKISEVPLDDLQEIPFLKQESSESFPREVETRTTPTIEFKHSSQSPHRKRIKSDASPSSKNAARSDEIRKSDSKKESSAVAKEDGEVSPTLSQPQAKKIRVSKNSDDEVRRRERERSKDEKRKKEVSVVKIKEEGKTREVTKRPADHSDFMDTPPKLARKEGSSSERERISDQKSSRTTVSTRSRTGRRSREPHRSKENL